MYRLLIEDRGDITMLAKADPLPAAVDTIIGLTLCIVQLFFAWRLHIIGTTIYPGLAQPSVFSLRGFTITRQHWLTLLISICSLVPLVGDVWTGIASLPRATDYVHPASIAPIDVTSGCFTIVADILITWAMTYHLRRAKGTFARTDRLLDRIIQRGS